MDDKRSYVVKRKGPTFESSGGYGGTTLLKEMEGRRRDGEERKGKGWENKIKVNVNSKNLPS